LLQRQTYLAQRMEAVGRLAGGVAHDFNNILTAIIGFSTLLTEQVKGNEAAMQSVQEVLSAASRASALTRQLLAFGRRQVLHPVEINLNDTLAGLVVTLRRLVGDGIDLQIICKQRLPTLWADQAQLQTALINLVVNARDAMPTGGRLTIETDDVVLDDEYCAMHVGVTPGPYVRLSVTDTGAGIPIEMQHQIFEPFFTTKKAGPGEDLGLATVYGIVKQSGGNIWVYSETSIGTTFKVYLPVYTDDQRAPLTKSTPLQAESSAETVLLVEDADVIRRLARQIIQRAGYQVIEAADAEKAMVVAGGHSGDIHLLLTDVIMPGASGVELAAQLKSVRPDLKVLYMSGYTDNAIVRNGLLSEEAKFLQKPFTPDELIRKVRHALGTDNGSMPNA
jgi:CheY-like chemotaxis protein